MSESHSHKKPRTSIPFLPDPSKWIQTSGPSTSKKQTPVQRPMVGFKAGFPTPPTTLKRRDPTYPLAPGHAHGHPNGQHDTPTAGAGAGTKAGRQGLMNSFLTPPSTSTSKKQTQPNANTLGMGSAKRRGSPTKKSVGRSKLALPLGPDDDSTSDLATRPKVRPLQSHRSAPVTSSSSGMSDAVDQEEVTPIRRKKKRCRTLTSSPSPPIFDHHEAQMKDDGEGGTPIASHVSSDRPITPVPDYVLDIRRRLCGRDTERMARVTSPWRTRLGPDPVVGATVSPIKSGLVPPTTPVPAQAPNPKPKGTRILESRRHEVDVRAHDQALVRRRRKQDKNRDQENMDVPFPLVRDSSQGEGTPKKRKRDTGGAILSPRPNNTVGYQIGIDSSLAQVGMKSPTRHRQPISPGHKKVERLTPDFGIGQAVSVESGPLAVYQAFRAPSPMPHIRTPRRLKRAPTGLSPRSAIPLGSPSPSPVKHHHTTPPKVATSSRLDPSKSSPPVTRSDSPIMTSPVPEFASPPQPIFSRSSASPSKVQDFRPVSMDAETLMTWSLGPQARPAPPQTTATGPERPGAKPVQAPSTESQKQDPGETQTQSLAPSATSQSFPNLLLSPTRPRTAVAREGKACNSRQPQQARPSVVLPETMRRSTALEPNDRALHKVPSLARFPTDLGVPETFQPASPRIKKGKSSTKLSVLDKSTTKGWPSTGFGLHQSSSPPPPPPPADTSPTGSGSITPRVKRKARESPSGEKQSKLASFGFFSDNPPKAVRGFDQEWDQEEDFELEVDEHEEEATGRPRLADGSRMGRVPEPPPHPDLRAAGLRELKRRQLALDLERTGQGTKSVLDAHGDDPEHRYDEDQDQDQDYDQDQDEERERPLFPEASISSQHGVSTDDQSSLTTDDDLGMNGSVAAWYEGLEDRRSSEFGSVSEM